MFKILSFNSQKILWLGTMLNIKPRKFSGENTIANGAAKEVTSEGDGKHRLKLPFIS